MQDLNALFVGDFNIPIRGVIIKPENIKRFYAVHPASFRIGQIPEFLRRAIIASDAGTLVALQKTVKRRYKQKRRLVSRR